MKLDRNINGTGRGKYGLIKTRVLNEYLEILPANRDVTTMTAKPGSVEMEALQIANAIEFLEAMGILDWGPAGTESEFFVIKLRDRNARAALDAYQRSAASGLDADLEYAADVHDMANRAGGFSPFCKNPD